MISIRSTLFPAVVLVLLFAFATFAYTRVQAFFADTEEFHFTFTTASTFSHEGVPIITDNTNNAPVVNDFLTNAGTVDLKINGIDGPIAESFNDMKPGQQVIYHFTVSNTGSNDVWYTFGTLLGGNPALSAALVTGFQKNGEDANVAPVVQSLAVGAQEAWVFTVTLPDSIGPELQAKTANISLAVCAVQQRNNPRASAWGKRLTIKV